MSKNNKNKHTISVLVENHFGVLARVSSLFAGRGYNIDSLTVGETEDNTISRMTIVVHGDADIIEQVTKQLNKLIDVIKVNDISEFDVVDRELLLLKVNCANGEKRHEILELVNAFKARTIGITRNNVSIEISGDDNKIETFLDVMRPFGIMETVKSGKIAMTRQ